MEIKFGDLDPTFGGADGRGLSFKITNFSNSAELFSIMVYSWSV